MRLPLRAPAFSYIERGYPFIIRVDGMLPLMRAFIYEQTVSMNGKIEDRGAIGAILRVDLKVFLFGRMTSI